MDEVKAIFKALIAIPVTILIVYTFINGWYVYNTFLKLDSISEMAMDAAVRNNYIPEEQENVLQSYMNDLNNIEIINSADIKVDTSHSGTGNTIRSNNKRVQYNNNIAITASCNVNLVTPFIKTGAEGKPEYGHSIVSIPLHSTKYGHGMKYYPDLNN